MTMTNEIQVFNNNNFGELRTIEKTVKSGLLQKMFATP